MARVWGEREMRDRMRATPMQVAKNGVPNAILQP